MISVLFVCLGNICRSPTAHGVFEGLLEQAGLESKILVDSAGTGDWHLGEAPDKRTQLAASHRGYRLDHLRARQVDAEDFHHFDYILAMDNKNYQDLEEMKPKNTKVQLKLFLNYAESITIEDVPDPYYGGYSGFEDVLDLIEMAAESLLHSIKRDHKL